VHPFCNLQGRARTHYVLVIDLYELLGTGAMMRDTGEMMRGTGEMMCDTGEMMSGTGEMMRSCKFPTSRAVLRMCGLNCCSLESL